MTPTGNAIMKIDDSSLVHQIPSRLTTSHQKGVVNCLAIARQLLEDFARGGPRRIEIDVRIPLNAL